MAEAWQPGCAHSATTLCVPCIHHGMGLLHACHACARTCLASAPLPFSSLPQLAWPEHKKAHSPPDDAWLFCIKRGRARSEAMPDFEWTGPLRPYKISPRRQVGPTPCPRLRQRPRLAPSPPASSLPLPAWRRMAGMTAVADYGVAFA